MLLAPLLGAFQPAKRLTDRQAPMQEQRILASLIDSGAHERQVRRIRRENKRRRATLLESAARWMSEATRVEGVAAGLPAVVWLPVKSPRREKRRQTASAGFVLGYASLSVTGIERGARGRSASAGGHAGAGPWASILSA